ncbi:MAG: efflux RND transporter periplasmic adaptor subunit [Sedimentisphaerales bacterium]|nr:efflux RND transporter periplasmic adaptor subunit [Sedimentisphaerales bacterium]
MTTDSQINAFQEKLASLEREISQLSVSERSTPEYFRIFLELLISVIGEGGAVWKMDEGGGVQLVCHMNLSCAGLEEEGAHNTVLKAALAKVIETYSPVVLPAQGGADIFDGGLGKAGINNDSSHALMFVPIISMNSLAAILLLISPTDVDPRAIRGYLGFVQGLCERAGVFIQRQQIRELEDQIRQESRYRQYVSSLHHSLDPRRSCYALANYAQELLGVFRCMAGTFSSRGKFRMDAVSGLESVAVKSNFIQSISVIARQVCRNDKVLIVENPDAAVSQAADQADDLLTMARLYMLQAGTIVMGIFPIRQENRVVGALVVEKATEEKFDQFQRKRIDGMLQEAASAFSNSLAYRDMPLSLLTRPLGAIRDKLYAVRGLRRLVYIAAALAVVLAPFLIPWPVKVIGTAELVPVNGRILYVEQEGVIESVTIPEDRRVKQGQVLASLDMRLINSEIQRVESSISETEMARDQARNNGQTTLTEQYDKRREALQAELDKYMQQKAQYQIVAPVNGTVITGETQIKQLTAKPVIRGESVLEIIPDESGWQLLVHVAENESGELLKAYDRLEKDQTLPARVILNAYPDRIFPTQVLSVARKAQVFSTGPQKYRNVIEVRVAQPDDLDDIIIPRQGMEGKVAIECDRRSFFYALTHDFINFIRVSWF